MSTQVWAHRGASGYLAENTLPAFELAVRQGADGVELDVHLSADGCLIVTHDENALRVTGQNLWIRDLNWQQIQALNFAQYRGKGEVEAAPRLPDVLDLVKRAGVALNIELKNSVFPYAGMEEKVLELVKSFEMEDQVIYSSFNHASIRKMRELGAKSRTGLLYAKPIFRPWRKAKAYGANALHPYYKNLMLPGYMRRSQACGIQVHPWTVNSEKEIQFVLNKRADALITNYPDIAVRLRDTYNAEALT